MLIQSLYARRTVGQRPSSVCNFPPPDMWLKSNWVLHAASRLDTRLYKAVAGLYQRCRIRWLQRENTLVFNRAFNAWAYELRRNDIGKTKG